MHYSNYVQADLTNKLEQHSSIVISSTIYEHEQTTNLVTADTTYILVLHTPINLALIQKVAKKC